MRRECGTLRTKHPLFIIIRYQGLHLRWEVPIEPCEPTTVVPACVCRVEQQGSQTEGPLMLTGWHHILEETEETH